MICVRPQVGSFNPRPRARGDARHPGFDAAVVVFQSTPPREGRPLEPASKPRAAHVSIHAPARGATLAARQRSSELAVVSIHAPARGATRRWRISDVLDACFNPRPARGATRCARASDRQMLFQSTPPRGGRLGSRRSQRACTRRFNPRPRARGDRARPYGRATDQVSIHAPARGATSVARRQLAAMLRCFNPRPRARGDDSGSTTLSRLREFQSTPPRGGRRRRRIGRMERLREFQSTPPRGGRPTLTHAAQGAAQCFNPRPRARGDVAARLDARPASTVSIHAPARGATACARGSSSSGRSVSIHAPARGATTRASPSQAGRIAFQSTPPRGGRRAPSRRSVQVDRRFNPRPRARGDAGARRGLGDRDAVSIHAPARGATGVAGRRCRRRA